MLASYRRRSEKFDDVGTEAGTYQEVYRSDGYNPDLNEHLFAYHLMREALGNDKALKMSHKKARTSCVGVETLTTVNSQLLGYLLNAPVLPETLYQEDRMCPICYEVFKQDEKVIVTECHHLFHQECGLIWAWQIIGGETCASCRIPIESLYFGTYDKTRENINASLIRVLTAVPGDVNLWRVSQFEYCQRSQSPSTGWDCQRILLDLDDWSIASIARNGQIYYPAASSQAKYYPHPPSPRQLKWEENPRRQRLLEARKQYRTWKDSVLKKIIDGFPSLPTEADSHIPQQTMERVEKWALEGNHITLPEKEWINIVGIFYHDPFPPSLEWFLLMNAYDDVPDKSLSREPRYYLRDRYPSPPSLWAVYEKGGTHHIQFSRIPRSLCSSSTDKSPS